MIEVKNITHYYGEEKILDNISFTLEKGSFTVLTGESGSGKTTLLSIVSTLLQPTSGEVKYTDIPLCTLDEMRNKYIGFVFQFHYLIAHLNVYENIKMVTKKKKDEILKVLERLGIESLWNKYPSQISGGQRQRAAIARAIINDPLYIFADEPTGNLDSKNSQSVLEILRGLDATVLLVTHEKSYITKKDNLLYIHDGKLEVNKRIFL